MTRFYFQHPVTGDHLTIETLPCGTPVVSYDVGDAPDLNAADRAALEVRADVLGLDEYGIRRYLRRIGADYEEG